jgi:AcrR family transcriptional regulator
MVDTPWGASESLRDRRLSPGPGNSPEEVADNQRRRLFGAMVASVAQRGYAATRVADLVELSGVSSRAFYDLFPDKRACFLATLEELLSQTALGGVDSFVELIGVQSAAARICLVEAYAAGPEAGDRLDDAAARVESMMVRATAESSERPAFPPEMVSAYFGAIAEVARTRLRLGREAELPGLIDDIADLASSYRPPPEPFRAPSRRAADGPEPRDAHDHAERILRALTAVVAEHGYAEATVEQVVKEAGISWSMFYAHFEGKDDALLAAIDSGCAQIAAAVVPVFRRGAEWPQGVRTALGGFFSFLASRPALARLLMVEVFAGGPAALAHREEGLRPIRMLFGEGRSLRPDLPAVAFEAIAGGIDHLAYRRIRETGPESLPALAPICSYIALAPFIGAREACAAANADGRYRGSRAPDPEAVRAVGGEPIRQRILRLLAERNAGAGEIAIALGVDEAIIEEHLQELRDGIVETIERRAGEEIYRSRMRPIETEEWSRLDPAQRQLMSAQFDRQTREDFERATSSGAFDARPEMVRVRIPHSLDEQGWRELSDLHAETVTKALEIQRRSGERLEASGDSWIAARTILAFFEVSP